MSTIRLLPLGVPVAAGVSTTGQGAVIVLSVIGLLVLLLAVRAIGLRDRIGNNPTEGPRA